MEMEIFRLIVAENNEGRFVCSCGMGVNFAYGAAGEEIKNEIFTPKVGATYAVVPVGHEVFFYDLSEHTLEEWAERIQKKEDEHGRGVDWKPDGFVPTPKQEIVEKSGYRFFKGTDVCRDCGLYERNLFDKASCPRCYVAFD